MHRACTACLFALALVACDGRDSAVPAKAMQTSTAATASVGGAQLHVTTMDVADLNDAVARRYAIDRSSSGVLLLITVRDGDGNGIEPGDLRLDVTAAALPEAAKPLPLHPITTAGMTDYIGVFRTSPPATVQFRISAVRNGARAEIASVAELYPR